LVEFFVLEEELLLYVDETFSRDRPVFTPSISHGVFRRIGVVGGGATGAVMILL
jgi:hypothetical protein